MFDYKFDAVTAGFVALARRFTSLRQRRKRKMPGAVAPGIRYGSATDQPTFTYVNSRETLGGT
jgi:hypothetical protein